MAILEGIKLVPFVLSTDARKPKFPARGDRDTEAD
jgi:hypothetical protein